MNKLHDNELDKLFADSLEDLRVEPSEHSWKKIAAGITVVTTASTTLFSSILKPIIWSLSTAAAVTVLIITNPTSNNIYPERNYHSKNNSKLIAAKPLETRNVNIINLDNDEKNAKALNINTNIATSNVNFVNEHIDFTSEENTNVETSKKEKRVFEENIFESNIILKMPIISSTNIPFDFNLSSKANLLANNFIKNSSYVVPTWWEIGANIGPSLFNFSKKDDIPDIKAINFGIDASFHFGDFFIKSGGNIINLAQQNKYNYTKPERQIIGYGSLTPQDKPVGNPQTQIRDNFGDSSTTTIITISYTIYDTVNVKKSIISNDRYSYFEIPIYFGFQKDINRFSFYIQSGFSFAYLIKFSEMSEDDFIEEYGETPKNLEVISPINRSSYSFFLLSAGVMYNTKSHFSFGIEPNYKYSLNPYFEGEKNIKSPIIFGVNARIAYSF